MIADWKLELMGQKILEQVFGEQRDLISYTCDLIRQCYRTAKPAETSLTNITARMERIKKKKETLLDMRTDGEITKEEFLHQRQKLDAELQSLTTEYENLSHSNVIALEQPEWGKIQDALEEILDLSQPKPSPDLIRKFVTKIVPDGKSNFRWYMNLDGNNTTIQNMTVEGRKNKAVVTLCQEEADDTPDSRWVINLQTIQTTIVFPSPLVMHHRLQSRANPEKPNKFNRPSFEGRFLLVKENHPLVVPKSFSYAQSAAAESLPLMREVGSRDGGRETRREISLPQSFASQNPAPSAEEALAVCVTASAVVGQDTQAKENSKSL